MNSLDQKKHDQLEEEASVEETHMKFLIESTSTLTKDGKVNHNLHDLAVRGDEDLQSITLQQIPDEEQANLELAINVVDPLADESSIFFGNATVKEEVIDEDYDWVVSPAPNTELGGAEIPVYDKMEKVDEKDEMAFSPFVLGVDDIDDDLDDIVVTEVKDTTPSTTTNKDQTTLSEEISLAMDDDDDYMSDDEGRRD